MSNAVYGPVWNCFASHAPGIQLNYELFRKPTCISSVYHYLARLFFFQDHGHGTLGTSICCWRFVATVLVSSVFFINGCFFKQTRHFLCRWTNGVLWRLHRFPSCPLPCVPQQRRDPPLILYALGKLSMITRQQA